MFLYYFDCGSHAAEAYSNIGRTNDVYDTALLWVGQVSPNNPLRLLSFSTGCFGLSCPIQCM